MGNKGRFDFTHHVIRQYLFKNNIVFQEDPNIGLSYFNHVYFLRGDLFIPSTKHFIKYRKADKIIQSSIENDLHAEIIETDDIYQKLGLKIFRIEYPFLFSSDITKQLDTLIAINKNVR